MNILKLMWYVNNEMDIKETGFVLYLTLQYSTKQSGIFGKVNGFVFA
jgi:hypothetical protein